MRKIYLFFVSLLFLFTANAQVNDNLAKQLVASNAVSIGLSQNDMGNYIVSSSYFNETAGTQMVYLNQSYKGLPVYNQILVLAFKDGKLIYKSGSFLANVEGLSSGASASPSITPDAAVRTSISEAKAPMPAMVTALNTLENGKKYNFGKLNIAAENVTAELMWVPVEDAQNKITAVKLAWQVQLYLAKQIDYWHIRVDANANTVVDKNTLTVSENFGPANPMNLPAFMKVAPTTQNTFTNTSSASTEQHQNLPLSPSLVGTANYTVIPWPAESPIHAGGAAASRTNPWTLAGGNAVSLGWHNDGAVDYTSSRGNNVWAQEDRDNNNATFGIMAQSTTTPDPLNFTYAGQPNYTVAPETAGFQQFALTNLFYWNNLLHDLTYNYGFTEPARNFQNNNQGRGGAQGDYVIADGQDAGGVNNANMATPADGNRPRMQMYFWNPTASQTTLTINTPPVIAGNYTAVEGAFSTANLLANVGPKTGQVVWYNDDAAGNTHYACNAPNNNITGKIALIMRGFGGAVCTATVPFTQKVLNAQAAGAIAVIMVNNVGGAPIVMGGGPDNTIVIPAVMVSDLDGALFAAQLTNNVNATLSGTAPGTIQIDGDIDNGVVAHEFFHGVSNRLTGAGIGCLGNSEQAGEGWSDYMALMITTNWATATVADGFNIKRPIGNYAAGFSVTGPGIRTHPYSTNMAVNPLTLADLPTAVVPHGVGTVFCTALWEMTWQLIQSAGISTNIWNASGTGGNVIALKLVIEGLKLQPCSPGFLDARNAIIQADVNLYGGAHVCQIWTAFAKRGMGFSAIQGSSNSNADQTPAFDMPPTCATTAPVVTINQAATQVDPTSSSPIVFTAVFDQTVTGFATGDVTLSGTAGGPLTATVVPVSGSIYTINVTGMSSSGTVIATIPAGVCQNASAQTNNASTSTDNTVTYNLVVAAPTVTINQAAGQADPTGTSPINFTAVFDQPVTGFATGDVIITGTAGATIGAVTGGPTTYNVAVSNMTGSGTVIANIPAGVCQNASAQNNLASTSTDNTVTYNAPASCTSVNAIPSDTVCAGSTHPAVVFTSPTPGTTFSWVNNNTAIGLGASGTGNLPAFTATNATTAPITGTITVTPTLTTVTPTTTTFNFTGGAQTFTVPAGVTSINLTTLGAQGGTGTTGGNGATGGVGGLGSRATGTLAVTAGQVLTIFVGGQGGAPTAGFNGGGTGGNATSGGGGGASDVRFPGASSADRILVAAGGGGGGRAGCEPNTVNGGAGGNGDGNGANGATSPNGGGGFGAIGVVPGLGGIGCPGFIGSPGLAGFGPAGGNGGAGEACCCFNFASVPGGGGGGGGFLGGAGGGGGSAGTVLCSGNDKGGGGGGAGGVSNTGGVTAGAITTAIQSGNGQVVLNYNVTTVCTGPTRAFTITVNPTPTVNAIPNQTVCAGAPTTAVNFTGTPTGVTYNWTNNTPAIGLAASGTGNIPSFIAQNPGATPLTATITVTPVTTTGSGGGGPVTPTPELFHYRFDGAGVSVPNLASAPPAGTATATIVGANLSQGGTGQCNTALVSTGGNASYVNTNWATVMNSPFTLSFWLGANQVDNNPSYLFGDVNAGAFRSFYGGAALANNMLLRGGSGDILITGVNPAATLVTVVYNGTNTVVYKNGGSPQTYAVTFANSGAGPFKVGGYGTALTSYTGSLDEFRIYNRALSAAEVATLTNCAPAGPGGGITCTGTPRTFTITVNPNPAIVIIADPGTTLCEGDPTLLTVVTGAASTSGPLYTQPGVAGASPNSQAFEPANVAFNNQAAEDFVVPVGATWTITQVSATGLYFNGAGPSTSFNVFFYNNAGGIPGSLIASYTNLTYTGGASPVITVPNTVLPAGTYWVSIQSNMAFTAGGQWAWGAAGVTATGNPWAWQNPNGGFAVCPTWGNGAVTCIPGSGRNLLFTLTGTSVSGGGPLGAGYTFLWSPAAGLSSTTSNPVAASPMNTTTYTVVATGPGPAFCSRTATVTITVNKRPVVTTQPANQVKCVGTTATFTVGATGTGLTYQWQVATSCAGPWTNLANAAPYSGVNTATLTVNPVTQLMSGLVYRVIVTGICAPWTPPTNVSGCATLTVNPNPVVTITPAGPVCGGVAGINGTLLSTATTAPPVPGNASANSGTINVPIPDGTGAAGTSNLTIAGVPANATITEIKVNVNINHTWVGDVDVNLRAPNNAILNLVGSLDGGLGGNATDNFVNTTFSSLGGNVISGAAAPRTDIFAAEARTGYGPTGFIQTVTAWTGLVPTGTPTAANGQWTLAAGDFVATDFGAITNWSISIDYTTPGSGSGPVLSYVWSPLAGLYTNSTTTVAYTGTNTPSVYAAPTALTTYTVTATDVATGCFSTASVLVNYTPPAPTVTPNPVTMCLGDPAVRLIASSSQSFTQSFNSGTLALAIPDGPATWPQTLFPGVATPNLAVSGIPAGATITGMSVKLNLTHTYIADMVIVLKAPNGNVFNIDANVNRTGGAGANFINTIISSASSTPLSAGLPPYSSTFAPDAVGATYIVNGPGGGNTFTGGPTTPAGYIPNVANFNGLYSVPNGNWTLGMYDWGAGDLGTLTNWELTINYVVGVPSTAATWSPIAGLYNDAGATIPYAGTPRDTVWTKPTPSGVYNYQVTVQSLPAMLPNPVAFTNPAAIAIPIGGAATPYPSNLTVSGLPTTGVSVNSVLLNGINHTWGEDVDVMLQSPTGQNVTLMSDVGGTAAFNATYTFADSGPAMSITAANATGTYKPTNNGAADNYPAPGPGAITDATPALATFTGNMNGVWKLFAFDDDGIGDQGAISGGYTIRFNVPVPPCTSPARTVVVTVNQPTTVATQPVAQTICTDKVATFTVVAAGSGPFSYQWQVSTTGIGGPYTNIANGGVYSGATTATLTITAPPVSMNGYYYRVVINGAAPCAAAPSNGVLLTVNALPAFTISANRTSLMPGMTATITASSITPPATPFVFSWIRNGVVLNSSSLGVVSGIGTNALTVDVDGQGDYQLRVTDANLCSNISNIVTIRDSASGKCFIYPNPTSGIFQVRYYSVANNVLPRSLTIYDAKGDRVMTKFYTIGRPYDRMDVDMRANGKGLYWVEIGDLNGNRLTMCRVVIQ